ncbi:Uncharacterized protein Rs2_03857 [Raphanus sativus]|nr:Uncharacterized protein Rs2_03857 [Raphanus sativus]
MSSPLPDRINIPSTNIAVSNEQESGYFDNVLVLQKLHAAIVLVPVHSSEHDGLRHRAGQLLCCRINLDAGATVFQTNFEHNQLASTAVLVSTSALPCSFSGPVKGLYGPFCFDPTVERPKTNADSSDHFPGD